MKSIITLSVDSEVILELRSKKLNVSKICNDFLREYLALGEGVTGKDNEEMLRKKVIMAKAKLKELEEIYRKEQESVIIEGQRYSLKDGEYVKAK